MTLDWASIVPNLIHCEFLIEKLRTVAFIQFIIRRILWVTDKYDIRPAGHVSSLKAAYDYCDCLILELSTGWHWLKHKGVWVTWWCTTMHCSKVVATNMQPLWIDGTKTKQASEITQQLVRVIKKKGSVRYFFSIPSRKRKFRSIYHTFTSLCPWALW